METHAHDYFEVISFIIAKIYNILQYVIARILRRMYNLYIKETEISPLLCHFKCSFKQDKLDFRVQFSFKTKCAQLTLIHI